MWYSRGCAALRGAELDTRTPGRAPMRSCESVVKFRNLDREAGILDDLQVASRVHVSRMLVPPISSPTFARVCLHMHYSWWRCGSDPAA